MVKFLRIIFTVTAVVLLVSVLMFIIPVRPGYTDSGYREVMGTFGRIVAVGDTVSAKRSIENAFRQIEAIEALMSRYKEDSVITRINRYAFEDVVSIDDDTFRVIKKAIEYSELTDGAFDITIGPLVELWSKAAETKIRPTQKQIGQAKSKVGFEKLILDEDAKTVRFSTEGMKLDLGGIAKGYAIDKAIEILQHEGMAGAMVDIGGDIRCFGVSYKKNKKWLIGLQDPDVNQMDISTQNKILVLELGNSAVATSGHYRRFVLIGDQKVSHILDPKTARPAVNLDSTTIITERAVDADALATAASVLGPSKAVELIETIAQVEAVMIPAGQTGIIKTSGADKYILK